MATKQIDLNSKEQTDKALYGYNHTHQAGIKFKSPYYCSYCDELLEKYGEFKEKENE